jgi:hypothetical protein
MAVMDGFLGLDKAPSLLILGDMDESRLHNVCHVID